MSKHLFGKCTFVQLCFLAMAMLLCFPASGVRAAQASQQNLTVSGVVTSAADQLPLIGVSVQVKGTTNGAITDLDGNYTVSVASGETLVFSYIGFKTQEIQITNQTTLNVVMEEDSETLDEVVVVGYGVQKKKLVTGATVQVKGETLAKMNTNSPLQAMQGQTPGVNISSTSGQPGEGMKVSIRGLGTVGNASPLYLIDGVGGDISTLNPADIESIDVLKDAASAAIYGAQAANGVVLITTKSGKAGKAQISFDAYYGWQTQARKADMLNSREYMMIMDEQAVNSGNAPYDWNSFESIYDANGNVYDTDWVNSMFQNNAQTQSYTLGITGGSETSTYAMSLGYMSQEGIVGGKDVSNYERYNFRINSEHKIFKDSDLLKVGEQVSFVYKMNNGISVGNQYNNTLRGAFGTSPLAPIYSDNNIYDSPYNDTTNSDWYNGDGNPYGSMMTNSNNENKDATFSGNVYAELQPIKNLKFRTVFGAVYSTNEYRSFSPLYHFSIYSFNDTRTSAAQNMTHGLTMTWTNTATYDWTVGEHAFNALVGMEISRYNGTYLRATNGILRDGFDDWEHAYVDNGTATSTDNGLGAAGHPNDETRTVSYFARFGWNWKETYMINATVRADGSSRFARGNRYGVFPSVSAGWTISNEAFMEDTYDWLDFLKLRVSWGQVGNQNGISNYDGYLLYNMNNGNGALIGGGLASTITTSGNLVSLTRTWEKVQNYNVGLDFGFFKDRLVGTVEVFTKRNNNMLVGIDYPSIVGDNPPSVNEGKFKSWGYEGQITWRDRIGKDFSYSIGGTFTFARNQLVDYGGAATIKNGYVSDREDYPIRSLFGLRYAGKIENEEMRQAYIDKYYENNGIGMPNNLRVGDNMFADVNGDGKLDYNDYVYLGPDDPEIQYSINAGIQWKGIDFSIVFQGAANRTMWNGINNWTVPMRAFYTNTTNQSVNNVWSPEHPDRHYCPYTDDGAINSYNYQASSWSASDGAYIRLKNLTLGYTFPAKLFEKQNVVSGCRLYFTGTDLWEYSQILDGWDPEAKSSASSTARYPFLRGFSFGVNLTF